MDKPKRDDWDSSEYDTWRLKNLIVINKTRRIFSNTLGRKKGITTYGVNWNDLINSLKPFPKGMYNFHIDHIVPLSYFNFLHEDDSMNLTEIKKAWSKANLRIILKEKNMHKKNIVDLIYYPLKWEFVFENNKKKADEYHKFFEKLKLQSTKEWENTVIEW